MNNLIRKTFSTMRSVFRPFSGFVTKILINSFRVQKGDMIYYDNFDYWQKNGFHIIPNHFYHPIPDTSNLDEKVFEKKKMIGVKMNDASQQNLLKKLAKYKNEFLQFKKLSKKIDPQIDCNYYLNNLAFDGVDALLYYGLIRFLKPNRIVEIGSGWSTKMAAKASLLNGNTKLISIEPYPQKILVKGFPGLSTLIKKKIQDVPLTYFQQLKAGDILFIDSSHTIKIGGDVNYIYLEILPRLTKGVYVHVHDIFFPYDYPKQWVLKERRFWSEQYLLHAFLLFNNSFEIVQANSYMNDRYSKKVREVFGGTHSSGGGSIWLKRI